MVWLIWSGAALAFLGVIGLVFCIVAAMRARAANLAADAMKARMQQLVAMNLAALGISMIGLMMVVIGILLA